MSSDQSAAMSGTDSRIDIYETDVSDEQWARAPSSDDPHPESVAAAIEDAHEPADDELSQVEIQGRDQDAEIPMTVLADLENGDTVVQTSKGLTGPKSNDAKTSAGIGAEFGRAWSWDLLMVNKSAGEPNGHLEGSMEGGRWMGIDIPDGQTLVGRERIAAREAHLTHISELARNPAMEAGTIQPRRRSEVAERRHQQARECREAVSRMTFPSYSRPAFSRFGDDDIHEQAREDAAKHRAISVLHMDADTPNVASRWVAESHDGVPLLEPRRVDTPADAFDPDADVIEELTMQVFESVAGDQFDEGMATDVAERFGVDIRMIRRQVRDAYPDDPDDPLAAKTATLIDVTKNLFTGDCKHLDEIEPFWPAATAWLKVERRIDHSHDAIDQVVYVSDVAPNVTTTSVGGETAKLTIWDASDLDVDGLYPGDIIHAKNVKPGRYRQQLTLAATSTSVVDVVYPGDCPERYQTDSSGEQTPQRLDTVASGEPSGSGATLALPRYRQPWETHLTGELDWNESAAVGGGVQHRDPTWTRTQFHYPRSWQPDWKLQQPAVTPVARTLSGDQAADTTPSAGDEYAPKHRDDLAQWTLECNQTLDERLAVADESMTAETVLELPIAEDRPLYLRVYTTLVGDWTVPKDDARVLVTLENFETCRIQRLAQFNRTDGWLDRLADTIQTHA